MGFVLDNCCHCVNLRTGSFIIGYIGLVGSLVLSTMSIIGVIASSYIVTHGKNEKAQALGLLALSVLSLVLIIAIFYTVFNIILLVGLHMHKRDCVKAYLVFGIVFIVLGILGVIIAIIEGMPIGMITKSIITLSMSAYSLHVIRSYHLRMEESDKKSITVSHII